MTSGPSRAIRNRRWTLPVFLLLLVAAMTVAAAPPARAAGQIVPVLECVALNTDGTFTAVFGTDNQTGENVVIPVGRRTNGKWSNVFDPTENIGQPTLILTGRQLAVFTTTSADGGVVRWELGDGQATANRNGTPCADQPAVPDVPAALFAGVAALAGAAWGLRRTRGSGADLAA